MRRVFPAIEGAPAVCVIPLVYADGTGIAVTDIQHLYLTLWNAEVDESAGNILADQDHVEVRNQNGGSVSDDGVLTWVASAAANVVRDPRKAPGDTELHQFELEVHVGSDVPFRLLYGLRVRKMQKGVAS